MLGRIDHVSVCKRFFQRCVHAPYLRTSVHAIICKSHQRCALRQPVAIPVCQTRFASLAESHRRQWDSLPASTDEFAMADEVLASTSTWIQTGPRVMLRVYCSVHIQTNVGIVAVYAKIEPIAAGNVPYSRGADESFACRLLPWSTPARIAALPGSCARRGNRGRRERQGSIRPVLSVVAHGLERRGRRRSHLRAIVNAVVFHEGVLFAHGQRQLSIEDCVTVM
eukprot:COSAG06_NODE_3685_length_5014_cov_4.732452_4_plen_224_part_00